MAVFQFLHNLRRPVNSFIRRRILIEKVQIAQRICAHGYVTKKPATKTGGRLGPVMEKKTLPVETDAEILVNFVCGSNIYKEGEDVKIKEDSEYPDWLWSLRLDKPPDLEDLDPNTLEYWRRYRKLARRREYARKKGKKF